MSEVEHTPGPWVAKGIGGPNLCVTDGDSRYVVDRFVLGSRATEEHEANARLIAAAPDLLAALQAVMAGQIGGNVDHDAERFRAARAAIAKAIG